MVGAVVWAERLGVDGAQHLNMSFVDPAPFIRTRGTSVLQPVVETVVTEVGGRLRFVA